MLAIIPIRAFSDNYIWLVREGRHAAVVDPGDAAPVFAYLESEGLTLSAIVTTHHHGDHVGDNAALLARFPVPVFGPARETIPGRTRALAEGHEITVPGVGGVPRVLDIPGHTAGHIGYVGSDAEAKVAVEPGNAALEAHLQRDQDKRDRGLPTVPSTIAEERATNPFLRAGEPDVFAAAQARAGRPLTDAVDAFAVIREWKNGFR